MCTSVAGIYEKAFAVIRQIFWFGLVWFFLFILLMFFDEFWSVGTGNPISVPSRSAICLLQAKTEVKP